MLMSNMCNQHCTPGTKRQIGSAIRPKNSRQDGFWVDSSNSHWSHTRLHGHILRSKKLTSRISMKPHVASSPTMYCVRPWSHVWLHPKSEESTFEVWHCCGVTCSQIGFNSWNSWIGAGDCFLAYGGSLYCTQRSHWDSTQRQGKSFPSHTMHLLLETLDKARENNPRSTNKGAMDFIFWVRLLLKNQKLNWCCCWICRESRGRDDPRKQVFSWLWKESWFQKS